MGTGSPHGNSGVGLLASEGLPKVMGNNGTCCLYKWEHENISKGYRDQRRFWGAIRDFFPGNIQKSFIGIREVFKILLQNMGTQGASTS